AALRDHPAAAVSSTVACAGVAARRGADCAGRFVSDGNSAGSANRGGVSDAAATQAAPPSMTSAQSDVLQLTVSQFAERLRGWLSRRPELRRIAIVGEVTDCKPQPNGNVYFSLKDDRALLSCFAYRSEARSFPPLRDGDAVVATGTIDIWERRSEYQLRVLAVSSFGVGAIAAKVEALRKRLQNEG